MAFHVTRARRFSLNFQLNAICGVYEAGAAAVHFLACHGAKVDQKAELIVGVELLHIHVLGLVFFFHEKAADLAPNVPSLDAVVVQHVGRAVYRDADILYVGENVFVLISRSCSVRLYKKQQQAFH